MQNKLIKKINSKEEKIRNKRISLEMSRKRKIVWFFKTNKKLILYVSLVIWGLVAIFPFLWTIIASFNDSHSLAKLGINPIPQTWTTSNYKFIVDDPSTKELIGTWLKNSLIFSVATATLNIFFNFLAGYALARIKFRGKNLILWYLIVGMLIPAQITQVPQLILLIKMGLVGGKVSDSLFFVGIIFTGMTSAPWVFMVRQFYLNASPTVEEAAALDGLGRFSIFLRISIRQLIPLVVTMWVLIFMAAWNNYVMFTLWAGGSEDRMSITAGLQSIGSKFATQDPTLPRAITLAATNIAVLPVLVVYFASLYFQKRTAVEGEK